MIPAKPLRKTAAEMTGCIFQHVKKTFATVENASIGLNAPDVALMPAPVSGDQGQANTGLEPNTGGPCCVLADLSSGRSAHQIKCQN